METFELPIVDIGAIGLGATETKNEDLKSIGVSIRKAIESSGFCYLSNHGVDETLIDEYMTVSLDFFNQPEQLKRDFEREKGGIFGWAGYEKEVVNHARPGDLKECFNFKPSECPDEWAHDDKFRKVNISMFQSLSPLALRICDALSLAIGLEKDFFRKNHALMGTDGNATIMRSNFYPALSPEKVIQPGQVRIGEHADYGTLTLLYQDMIGGLEMKVPQKGYLPAPPVPGTFLINFGEILQRWTADDLLATEHRVPVPEDDSARHKCRQSFGFFLNPDNDAVIECTDKSDKYEPIKTWDFLRSKAGANYQ